MAETRNYRDGDLEACRALWAELTQVHRDLYDAQEIGGDNPGLEFDSHLAKVGADNLWVGIEGDDVIALAGLMPGDNPEVEPVIVTERARQTGIGRRLVTDIFDEARRRGLKQLVVRPVARNEAALRFFHGMGFCTIGQPELIARVDGDVSWGKPGGTLCGVEFDV